MHITLEPAFILHSRPYRETSLLLDVLTQSHGRLSLIARGVRTNKSKLRSILQLFMPLLLSWQGKSELMWLSAAENNGPLLYLQGDCLLSAFYLNELLIRLLQKQDPHPALYTIYHHTLLELQTSFQQQTLRVFEKKLLEELGYGLQLSCDFSTGEEFVADQCYVFYPERGFKRCELNAANKMQFKGKSLLALAAEKLNDEDSLRDVKRLMRIALTSLLGLPLLHSRKLFMEVSL